MLLALATFALARRARQEAKAVREEAAALARQVELEAEQLVAQQRPLVLPMGATDDQPHVVFKNAGPGPAINVRGFLWWTDSAGGASSLHPIVLAPGDELAARVLGEGAKPNWANAVGYVRYHDLTGEEWQTHYRFRIDGYGNRRVEVLAAGRTTELGEPGYNGDQGWVNKPEHIALWHVAV